MVDGGEGKVFKLLVSSVFCMEDDRMRKISRRKMFAIGGAGLVGLVGAGVFGMRNNNQLRVPFHTDVDRIDEDKVFAKNGYEYKPISLTDVIENPINYEGLPIEVEGVPVMVTGGFTLHEKWGESTINLNVGCGPGKSISSFAFSTGRKLDYENAISSIKFRTDNKNKNTILLRGVLRGFDVRNERAYFFELNSIDAYGKEYKFR